MGGMADSYQYHKHDNKKKYNYNDSSYEKNKELFFLCSVFFVLFVSFFCVLFFVLLCIMLLCFPVFWWFGLKKTFRTKG